MPVGVIKLKIDSCATMPSKRWTKLMDERLADANRVRNAVVRAWVRWREDFPEWVPEQRRIRDGSPKVDKKTGKPVMENEMISQTKEAELFHVYKSVAPLLASDIASGCWSEVLSDLRDHMPYNHDGSKYRWQAILNFEVAPPSYTGSTIPCSKKASKLIYTDDRFELRFPMLSQASGYSSQARSPVVRLKGYKSHGLSDGEKALLKRIAAGELRRADSTLVRKDGGWFYHLVYEAPIKDHGLNPDTIARLTPLRSNSRKPFELAIADGATWTVGDGIAFAKICERLTIRRRAIRNRYKDGAGKGHGKAKFYRALRPASRSVIDAQDNFRKHLVNEIVKFCIRNSAGTVVYREPTMPLRSLLWFDQKGLPFNWTSFAAYLKFKLEVNHIAMELEPRGRSKGFPRIGVAQHKLEYAGSWPVSKNDKDKVDTSSIADFAAWPA